MLSLYVVPFYLSFCRLVERIEKDFQEIGRSNKLNMVVKISRALNILFSFVKKINKDKERERKDPPGQRT
jgi:hypothetical protein